MTRFLLAGALALSISTAPPAQSVPDWAAPLPPVAAPEAPANDAALPPPPPPPIPIDGGLAMLALAGAGLAARKLRHA